MAVDADPVVVVSPIVDLRMLREIRQDASVGDSGFNFGLERPVTQGFADRRFEAFEPLAPGRADRNRFRVVGLEDVEKRTVWNFVRLVEYQ